MADQLWSNCADVELVVGPEATKPETPNPAPKPETPNPTPKPETPNPTPKPETPKPAPTPVTTPKIVVTTPRNPNPSPKIPTDQFTRSSCVSFYPCAKSNTGFCTGFLSESAKLRGVSVKD